MLPLELIDYIIDELGSRTRDTDSITALQQCARTARSFRGRARRYIFANATVIEQDYQRDTQTKVDNIRGILGNDPNVVNYFQEFTILLNEGGYLASNESGFVHVLNVIRTSLGRNALNKLTISTTLGPAHLSWPVGDEHYNFNQAIRTICEACIPEKVEIYGFQDVPLYILSHSLEVQAFSTTSTFTTAITEGSEMDEIFKAYPPADSYLLPCKWKTLEISGFFYGFCLALAAIIDNKRSPVFGNLEYLQIFMTNRFDRLGLDLTLRSAKNALRTLECVIYHPWEGPEDLVRTIDTGSASLANLRTLRLQFNGIPQLDESDFGDTIAENILILRPESQPSGSLSNLEIILNLRCDSQGVLDGVASYNAAWTRLDALIVDDVSQALGNVHFEIKVGTYLELWSQCETFNFDAFSDFFEKRLPRASRFKTLNLTLETGPMDIEPCDGW